MKDFESLYNQTLLYAQTNYPEHHPARHHSLASSVTYYVTGMSGGAGPSLRTHLCSWFLAGDGSISTISTDLGELTLIQPDGRLPNPGEWNYDNALEVCKAIVFSPLPQLTRRVVEQEYFFDDDPDDIEEMERRLVAEMLLLGAEERGKIVKLLGKLRKRGPN